jgi:hypothetical protein
MKGVTPGRTVHYVLEDGPHAGEHRPAIIVKVWSKSIGSVNLVVFMDGTNDGPDFGGCIRWCTSVAPSEAMSPRTWHWIENDA